MFMLGEMPQVISKTIHSYKQDDAEKNQTKNQTSALNGFVASSQFYKSHARVQGAGRRKRPANPRLKKIGWSVNNTLYSAAFLNNEFLLMSSIAKQRLSA